MSVGSVVGLVITAYGASRSRSAADKAKKRAKGQADQSYAATQQSTRNQLALAEVQYQFARSEGILSDALAMAAAADTIAEGMRVQKENIKTAKSQQLAYIKNGIEIAGTPAMVISETILEGEREVEAYTRRADSETRLGKLRKMIILNNAYAKKIAAGMDASSTLTAAELSRTGIYDTANAWAEKANTDAWTTTLGAGATAWAGS